MPDTVKLGYTIAVEGIKMGNHGKRHTEEFNADIIRLIREENALLLTSKRILVSMTRQSRVGSKKARTSKILIK